MKKLHIVIIILGIIFILLPVFHQNMWFDESYSVAISNHGFGEIWSIGSNDVHPVLYYWILHILNIIFGNKILIYRLFSTICIAILGIIGYTHIRKEFGEKAGAIFSFLAFFFPVNVVYAGEIRMYSFAMLLVTLMSIYGYRICKNKEEKNIKNWILFAIFSLASSYTHYYGLMIAGLENVFLFVVFLIQSIKTKKFTYNLKVFIISAIAQIFLYIPWIMSLFRQMEGVSKGFWISFVFPESLIEIIIFPFTGNLGGEKYIVTPLAILFATFIWGYMLFIQIKNIKSKELNPPRFAIVFWIMIIAGAYIVSLVMARTILYARYLLCVEGLFIFFISATMAIKGNKIINIIVLVLSFILSITAMVRLFHENYGKDNQEFQSYISKNVKEGDIFICANELSGFIIPTYYTNNKMYFYDKDNWNVGPAYKAYGETVYNFDFLKDYKGRIWLINDLIYEEYKNNFDLSVIEQKEFNVEYKKYYYKLTLVEK